MSTDTDPYAGQACLATIEELSEVPEAEASVSRRSLLRRLAFLSLPGRLSVASAALFAGIAARGATPAQAGNYGCCNLVRLDQWCGTGGGDPGGFWCNYGGFKRVWYCCEGNLLYGCGECISSTGTCFAGPNYYCSYGWVEAGHFC